MKKTYNPENDDEGLQFMAAQEKSRAKFGTFFALVKRSKSSSNFSSIVVVSTVWKWENKKMMA